MILRPGRRVPLFFPNRSTVQLYPCGTVLTPANRVSTASATITSTKMSKPKNTAKPSRRGPVPACCEVWALGLRSASRRKGQTEADISRSRRPAGSGYPALQLTLHDVLDDAHSGHAVVKAGNGGEILSAVMVKNLRILAGNFLQCFETVGGEARRNDCEIFHAALGQRLHGHVGVGLEPFRRTETRL